METVTSFLVNHDTLSKGVFLSNTERNISTFDLRFKKPNEDDFLSTASAHTIEHIFCDRHQKQRGQRKGRLFRTDGLSHGLLSAYV